MKSLPFLLGYILIINYCDSYKILAIFPYNGRSHHIYFSSIVEELAIRGHDVTVLNYFPMNKMPNLRQIFLENNNTSDFIDIDDHLKNLPSWFQLFSSVSRNTVQAFKLMANSNCKKLVNNKEIQYLIKRNTFDVVIVEQFVTDCGLALAHKLKAPTVGMTAHSLMPWTYSRLGITNHPASVPNHFLSTGTNPDLISKIKGTLIHLFYNVYYFYIIQKSDYEIVKRVYPETPDLEELGRNLSLILLNQYFPLTGSRLHGANVIEVGGMHIKQANEKISDKDLENFLNTAENGVVYLSFGSVAKNLPRGTINEITAVMKKSKHRFLWKVDDVNLDVNNNTILRKWLPQIAILCHRNVKAFVTHSGMLSSSEAMHCGVPIVSLPIFGDQFSNSVAAVENGLGVSLDLATITEQKLKEALDTVLHERYQKRAKQLSQLWRQRPLPPMDTAVFWIEYVAKYKKAVNLKPPTVDLPLYQYLLLDVILLMTLALFLTFYTIVRLLRFLKLGIFGKTNQNKKKRKVN